MKQRDLYDIIMADPMLKAFITTVPYDHKTPYQARQALRTHIERIIALAFDIPNLHLLLRSSYDREATNYVRNGAYNIGFKTSPNYANFRTSNNWAAQVEAYVVLLTRAGIFSTTSARTTLKTLFKKSGGLQFFGRHGNKFSQTKRTSAQVSDRPPQIVAQDIIASGFPFLLEAGRKVSLTNKDRVAIPLFHCPSSAEFTTPDPKGQRSARILYHVNAQHVEFNRFRVILNMRHWGDSTHSQNINRYLSNHASAALNAMPHVSGISTSHNKLMHDSCPFYVQVCFDIDIGNLPKTTISPEKIATAQEVLKNYSTNTVVTSPAALAGVATEPNVTEEDIRAFVMKKLSVLADDIGVLVDNRNKISIEIERKQAEMNKFLTIKEVL